MIKILHSKIEPDLLESLCKEFFGSFVKFVVDIEKDIIAAGGELHSDAEAVLLENGSQQKDLWGANFFPFKNPDHRLEYTSLINIRPSDENHGMEIKDSRIRKRVKSISESLLLSAHDHLA